MSEMKKALMIICMVTVISNVLCGCTIRRQSKGVSESGTDTFSKVTLANVNEEILKTYGSVEKEVLNVCDDEEERSKEYISLQVYYGDFLDESDEFFNYMDWEKSVSNTPDGEHLYSVIVDKVKYDIYNSELRELHYLYTDGYDVEFPKDGEIKLSNEDEICLYEYDPKTLLICKSEYSFANDDSVKFVNTYKYIEENRDQEYIDKVEKFVNEISNGEKVKLTIKRLDGSVQEFDFPKGFIPSIYGGEEYEYEDDSIDAEYYETPIMNDTVLVEIHESEEDNLMDEMDISE